MAVMHEKAAERQRDRLRMAAAALNHPDPVRRADARRALDTWLDAYADSLLRATEWDAGQWGFNPDKWMAAERVQLASRGGCHWPREVI
jgi:hypothetical protein